jgi:hypothetical protein
MATVATIPYFQVDVQDREGNLFVLSKVQYDGSNGNKFAVPGGATGGSVPAVLSPTGSTVPTASVANSTSGDGVSGAAAGATCTVTLPSGSTSGIVYVISMHPGRSPAGSR